MIDNVVFRGLLLTLLYSIYNTILSTLSGPRSAIQNGGHFNGEDLLLCLCICCQINPGTAVLFFHLHSRISSVPQSCGLHYNPSSSSLCETVYTAQMFFIITSPHLFERCHVKKWGRTRKYWFVHKDEEPIVKHNYNCFLTCDYNLANTGWKERTSPFLYQKEVVLLSSYLPQA